MIFIPGNILLIFTSCMCVLMITLCGSTQTYHEHEDFKTTKNTMSITLNNTEANDACEFIVENAVNNTYYGFMKTMANNRTAYEKQLLASEEYNTISNETYIKPKTCKKKDYCQNYNDTQITYCFRKCCQIDEIYIDNGCVVRENITFAIHHFGNFGYSEIVPIHYHKPACDLKRYDKFKTDTNERGAIVTTHLDKYVDIVPLAGNYCFDMHSEDNISEPKPHVFICLAEDNLRTECLQIAIYVSSICLLLTIAIYCSVYRLKKIMHLIIVSACGSQLVAFIFLTLRQLLPNIEYGCDFISFGTSVGLLSAFSWLGVMCFDVWRTVGSMKSKVGQSNIWKKYMCYSIFGWLYPITIGILAYFENQNKVLPEYLHVHVGSVYRGRRYCKMANGITEGNYSFLLFYIIPGAIPILSNLVWFSFTIRYILQARTLIRKSSKNTQETLLNNNHQKVAMMVLKLFLIMGVNWVFEVISQIIDFKTNFIAEIVETVFDTINCLQGVFIFLIFGCSWRAIKAKFTCFKQNNSVAVTTSETI